MKSQIELVCESISAEEIDYILPFIAVITNPLTASIIIPETIDELSYEIVCYEGFASVQTNNGDYLLSKNHDIVVYSTSKLMRICCSDNFRCHMTVMTKEFNDSIIETNRFKVASHYQKPFVLSLTNNQTQRSHNFFELLKFALREKPVKAEIHLRLFLRSSYYLFSSYREESSERLSNRNDLIAQGFLMLIENERGIIHDTDYYSNLLKISKRSLIRAVKQATSMSPQDHIVEKRILKAKALLSTTAINTSLTQIAESIGFNSLSSFTRFFKSKTRQTPTDYRNSPK